MVSARLPLDKALRVARCPAIRSRRPYKLITRIGDVIRTGPNSLSFVTPQAYREIYGHVSQGKRRFLKNSWYQQDEPRITTVRDPVAHGEQRRALSHAFSARALRNQEIVIDEYIGQLLHQISKLGQDGKEAVNVTEVWNWLTFDIIGEFFPGCLLCGSLYCHTLCGSQLEN